MAPKRHSKVNNCDKKSGKQGKDTKKNTESSKKGCKADNKTTGESKMTLCTVPTVNIRPQQIRERRPGRPPTNNNNNNGKRISTLHPGKVRSAFRRSLDPCDNSNDSGLGFDHHTDHHTTTSNNVGMDRLEWNGERTSSSSSGSTIVKKPRLDIKLENEDINDNYCFPQRLRTPKDNTTLIRTAPASIIPTLTMNTNQSSTSGGAVPRCIPLSNRQSSSSPVALTAQLTSTSRRIDVGLTIIKQPEQQHRARYQTEGSRGAVKDREGNGFPIVQLTGYYQPTTLQVFIGTDVGKVAPHMFYQACKVSGKNSTPCIEKKLEGTCVIELQLDPAKEMSATCDCVGILKERNVDVEHRFPDQLGNRSKKKSTRCRMIFRTTLTHDDGTIETLQVCSQPIVCTQPPGVPEICKKSLTSCPASGGLELFVLGKNFLKDTKVYFQQIDDDRHILWEQSVVPDKEYLQQTHFVCVVPQYRRPDITEPITVRLCVVSSGKTSESHQFVYTPVNGAIPSVRGIDLHQQQQQQEQSIMTLPPPPPPPMPPPPPSSSSLLNNTTISITNQPPQSPQQFFNKMIWSDDSKREHELGMMPPPDTSLVPLAIRRSSLTIPQSLNDSPPPLPPSQSIHTTLKQEFIDENSQNSIIDSIDIVHHTEQQFHHISESSLDVNHGDSNISMINDNSIDLLRHNENSMDVMTRRNSFGNNTIDDTIVCNGLVLQQQQQQLTRAVSTTSIVDDLNVIDLRMKIPLATVADLVNSNAPSMATLHSFGVTNNKCPLPTQSAQSIENFLTKIESKPLEQIPTTHELLQQQQQQVIPTANQQICDNTRILTHNHTPTHLIGVGTTIASTTTTDSTPVYLTTTQHDTFLSNTSLIENENAMHLVVAKSEAAALAEQVLSENVATISTATLETNTALVNSNIDLPTTQLIVGNNETNSKDLLLVNEFAATNQTQTAAQLIVPQIINHSSPISELNHQTTTTTPTTDVILNSQISPSLMCQNTVTDNLLQSTICCQQQSPTTVTVETNLLNPLLTTATTTTTRTASPVQQQHSPIDNTTLNLVNSEPEKVVLFKAAVDLLETQQKLSELEQNNKNLVNNILITQQQNDILTTNPTTTPTPVVTTDQLNDGSFMTTQQQFNNSTTTTTSATVAGGTTTAAVAATTSDLVVINGDVANIGVLTEPAAKEIETTQQQQQQQTGGQKNVLHMLPQTLATLSDHDLLNLLNTSCFDQGKLLALHRSSSFSNL